MRRSHKLLRGIEALSYYARPRYHQRANATRTVMRDDELPVPAQQRKQLRKRHPPTQVALEAWSASLEPPLSTVQNALVPLSHKNNNNFSCNTTAVATTMRSATATSIAAAADDDDIVVEPMAAASGAPTAAATKIGPDVLELVTDEFRELRERETKRRREYLYRITHPCATDYTYAGKLVPPPPLSFGQVTPESIALGSKLMLEQHYSLVKSAPSSHYFFEINDLYLEIVMVGKANAGKSSLINALLGQPEMAKTSSTPNSTREVRFYQSVTPEQLNAYANGNPNKLVTLPGGGLQLTFVDLPGFGINGMSEKWRDNAIACTDSYLGVRRSVNTVLFCVDCEVGMTKSDVTYMEWLENLHGVYWIILTKCDMVPHSRVCSVMRQLYALMTKYRRKFRKAFPMILPVSARDGTNIDVLRGLITETSGIVPGDRLRGMLKEKAKQHLDAAMQEEDERLWKLWEARRADARKAFQAMRGHQLPQLGDVAACEEAPVTAPPQQVRGRSRVELNLSSSLGDVAETRSAPTQPTKERTVLQYGGTRIKLNHGLADNDSVALEWSSSTSPAVPEQHDAAVAASATSATPSVPTVEEATGPPPIGKGPVSKYLDALEAMGAPSQRRRTGRPGQADRRHNGSTVKVVAEVEDGRFSEFKGGRSVGLRMNAVPTSFRDATAAGAPTPDSDAGVKEERWSTKQQWRAKRYAQLASKECPTKPWSALPALRKKEDDLRQNAALSKMSKRDLAAYLANRGSIVSGFERYENEVTTAKYMNEHRQSKTLRQKAQWELNAVDKVNYRSQPPGLLKAYGEKDSFWPTSSVIGL